MASYNSVDGVPAHANHWLLTKVLRGEWGFNGYVLSDAGGVQMNCNQHFICRNIKEASVLALRAGVDVALDDPACYLTLPESLREGKITMQELDQAVARVLRQKFVAGLFDGMRDPLPAAELGRQIHTAENVALSRQMAEESIILLKNDGNLLPLDAAKIKSIAVIGPNADQVQFGDYCWSKSNRNGVTVLRGLREWWATTCGSTMRRAAT